MNIYPAILTYDKVLAEKYAWQAKILMRDGSVIPFAIANTEDIPQTIRKKIESGIEYSSEQLPILVSLITPDDQFCKYLGMSIEAVHSQSRSGEYHIVIVS